MSPEDVKDTLDLAIEKTGIDKVKVKYKPMLKNLLFSGIPSYQSI